MPEGAECELLMEGRTHDEPTRAAARRDQAFVSEQLEGSPYSHPAHPVPRAETGLTLEFARFADVTEGDAFAQFLRDGGEP